MTYYEELGVQPDATVPEIRQAYKLAARLLHPDGQADPQLRALAECQMRRLSEVARVLSNPRLRLEYDAGLRVAWSRPAPRPWWVGWPRRHWFELTIAAVALAIGVWWFATRDADLVGQAPPPLAPPVGESHTTVRQPRQQPRPQPKIVRSKAAVIREPKAAQPSQEEQMPVPAPSEEPRTGETAEESATPPPATTVASHEDSPFAGNWLFLPPDRPDRAAGEYPATYAEMLLREENGALVGHFRSRYRVPDRAISPEVLLRVKGKPEGPSSATLPWTATDGSKGEVELTVSPPNLLRVNWWTTEFGRGTGLSSGTAVLVRQVAR